MQWPVNVKKKPKKCLPNNKEKRRKERQKWFNFFILNAKKAKKSTNYKESRKQGQNKEKTQKQKQKNTSIHLALP